MPFNSLEYLVFLPVAFFVYWLMPTQKLRNWVLIISSLLFYAYADLKMLFLLLAVCLLTYYVGRRVTSLIGGKIQHLT